MNTRHRQRSVLLMVSLGWCLTSQSAAWGYPHGPGSPDDRQRLFDLAKLVEGPNDHTIRRTGARELLRAGDSQEHVVRILRSANTAAQVAMVQALADSPALITQVHLDPLLDLLGAESEPCREAAIAALARASVGGNRLQIVATDPTETVRKRAAALEALGRSGDRDSIVTLVSATRSAEGAVAEAAIEALRNGLTMEFPGGAAEVAAWWAGTRELEWVDWQRLQIQRLQQEAARLSQQTRDLESRLTATLRESYFRLSDAERDAVLLAHLSDANPSVRRLGLELVQSRVAEGVPVTGEITLAADNLLTDPAAVVRAVGARTVTAFRNPEDAARFVELIAQESDRATRVALINGLGYLGGPETVVALIDFMHLPDEGSVDEVVGALGRLAERGMIDRAARDQVFAALMGRFPDACDQNGMESRLLWAMGRLADARFAPLFAERIRSDAGATTRTAAMRGLAILIAAGASGPDAVDEAKLRVWVDVAMEAATDPDMALRRLAVETLAQSGDSDAHLDALWDRAFAPQEPDESIRRIAWDGAVRMLTDRPVPDVLARLARVRELVPGDQRRRLDLLEIAEAGLSALARPDPVVTAEVRQGLAEALLALGQIDAAITAHLSALADVGAVRPEELGALCLTLLRLSLLNGKYDDEVATAIGSSAGVDGVRLWETARELMETRLRPELLPQAAEMADALAARPPAQFDTDILDELSALRSRIRDARDAFVEGSVNEALVRLRERPDDSTARQAIVDCGDAAAPALRKALRAVLSSEPLDLEAERRIHDLLKLIEPDWIGFPADAHLERKLELLSEPAA